MTREQIRAFIEEIGIIPAIRVSSPEDALFTANAVAAHGIPIVEVTMTVPGAIGVISELASKNSNLIIGAGSVTRIDTARRCIEAGAHFLTTTGFNLDVVRFAIGKDTVVFPGALTPTEVMAAWEAGPDFVKIFPCASLGGPTYIRALKGPFPHIPLIASGGVNQQTAADFILAGAKALGIGGELIPHAAIQLRQEHRIGELARRFLSIVREARRPPSERT
jgi:2-dehydro-3-deoxyphosphogluconate aldolase / (4S)-4-hydroxy-2-oxoglutarate aldolase